jgi:hypothetical protein
MASMTIVLPVPKGKVEHFRQFAKEALTERHDHHHSSRQKHGYTKEKAWLHKTPAGEILVVYLEAENLPEANEAFMKSKEPHDVWLKEKILGSLEHDPEKGAPPGAEGELIFDYEA